MRVKFLGDSYDIVKQSMIRWLRAFGGWAVHPMFTEEVSPALASDFSAFLGARLLSQEVLSADTDRAQYLAPALIANENVFLDPDTGVRLKPARGRKAPAYLFATELVALARIIHDRRPSPLLDARRAITPTCVEPTMVLSARRATFRAAAASL